MTRQHIQFYFRGRVHSVVPDSPTRTVLSYLREVLHQTGTKEGCAEGDCGACTVVVGELADGGLKLSSVNACIQFLPSLDGKALFTVEDLAPVGKPLHPVQQAMVDCHGSQCGFCTPGFVMSLWGMYQNQETCPPAAQVEDCLSGNLCRCTGYRPIMDAAQAAYQHPREALDTGPVIAALTTLAARDSWAQDTGSQQAFAPQTRDELNQLKSAHPDARLVAGSTDVGLWVTKQLRTLEKVIFLNGVDELKTLRHEPGWLEIGAGVTLEAAFQALASLDDAWEGLRRRFASLPVRHAGTLGGNVANGSPIGDSMPALIAAGAQVVLSGSRGDRVMPLEDLYLAYQKTAMQPDEYVRAVRVPQPDPASKHYFRIYKISKRFDQDISAVCAGIAITVEAGVIIAARLAFGGMAATPKRALHTEQALQGQPWSADSLTLAAQQLAHDFAPMADVRASAAYRRTVAASLLTRFWLETGGAGGVIVSLESPELTGEQA